MNGLVSMISESKLRDKLVEYLKTLSKAEIALLNEDTPNVFMPLNLFFIRHYNIVMYVDKYSYAFTYYDTTKNKQEMITLLNSKTEFIKCVASDKGIETNIGLCVLDVINYIEIPF